MSISDNGKTIAIGAKYNNGMDGKYSGRVRIYRLSDDDTRWEQIGEIDGDAAYDYLGYSVSLSANGTVVAIGAPGGIVDDSEIQTGHVKVLESIVQKQAGSS